MYEITLEIRPGYHDDDDDGNNNNNDTDNADLNNCSVIVCDYQLLRLTDVIILLFIKPEQRSKISSNIKSARGL